MAVLGLSAKIVQSLAESAGLNGSLPCAVFDGAGNLVGANRRMLSLLKDVGGKDGKGVEPPLSAVDMEGAWPFFNEEASAVALYRKLIADRRARSRQTVVAEAGLKHFRLSFASVALKKTDYRVVVAEMLRTGDLLQDRATRQALFRSISHEVRTSVLSLTGYMGMFEEAESMAQARACGARMKEALKRLDGVVKRLDEFRSELEVLEESAKRK